MKTITILTDNMKLFSQKLNIQIIKDMKHVHRFKLIVFSLIVVFISFLNFNVLAQMMDFNEVKEVALNAHSLNSNQGSSDFKIKDVIPISDNGVIAYYIFNFEPKGHILVSNEKSFEPILGYGLNSTIDFDSIPPGMKYLLDNFKDEIGYARKQGIVSNKETIEKWDYYLNKDKIYRQKSYSTGTYLLQTIWGQGSGYNQLCPFVPNTNIRTLVGCGGVALAQILFYWQCRVFPDNSISYTPAGFPNPISLNFYGQNYNWSGMSKTAPDNYNALLLYHSAVSMRSDFSSSSTTSYIHNARNAFVSYFGFNATNVQNKSSFSNDTWINMLKTEINAERPIYYAGYNMTTQPYYGHAWVIDGYNTSNQFHCNWGWNGQYINVWYLLSALNPGTYNFNDGQCAILNIYPLLDACSGLNGSTAICSSNSSYSITIPSSASVVWSKSSNLTQVGANTGTNYTVHATNSSQSGSGFITSTIYNSQGQIFLARTKNIWVGAPQNLSISGPISIKKGIIKTWSIQNASTQGVTGYSWYADGGIIPTGSTTSSTFNAKGVGCGFDVITCELTNVCGTGSNPSILDVEVICIQTAVDIAINVYPQPAINILNVELVNENIGDEGTPATFPEYELRLVDLNSNVLLTEKINSKFKTVDISKLRPGVYILQIVDGEFIESRKIIITK